MCASNWQKRDLAHSARGLRASIEESASLLNTMIALAYNTHFVAWMSHKPAIQVAIWGFLGGAVLVAFALWILDDADFLAAAAGLAGLFLIGWSIYGIVSLFHRPPAPTYATFKCRLGPNDSPIITAKDVGTNLLVINQVKVSFRNARDHWVEPGWASPFKTIKVPPHKKHTFRTSYSPGVGYRLIACRVDNFQGPET